MLLYERFLRTFKGPESLGSLRWSFPARGRGWKGAPYIELRFEPQSRQFVAYQCNPRKDGYFHSQLLSPSLTRKIADRLSPEAIAECTRASLGVRA